LVNLCHEPIVSIGRHLFVEEGVQLPFKLGQPFAPGGEWVGSGGLLLSQGRYLLSRQLAPLCDEVNQKCVSAVSLAFIYTPTSLTDAAT
jgi:hypothetical protein